MTQKPDNPPAFPTQISAGIVSGMTLRDYFATSILQGIVNKYGTPIDGELLCYEDGGMLSFYDVSYFMVDKMLEARLK